MDLHIFSMDDVYAIEWAGTLWHYNGKTPLQTATPHADRHADRTMTATDADRNRNADRDAHAQRRHSPPPRRRPPRRPRAKSPGWSSTT